MGKRGRSRSRSRSSSYGGRRNESPSPPLFHRRKYDSRNGDRFRNWRQPPPTSLLVRNIARDTRPEDLRIPFERFGTVKDVYLPRNYYTGEPRGFGFVKYTNPDDAAEAKHYMNQRVINGHEISVVFAEENRKNPEEMRIKTKRSRYGGGGYRRCTPLRSPRQRRRSYSREFPPLRRRSRDSPPYRSRSISHDRNSNSSRGRSHDSPPSKHRFSPSRSRSHDSPPSRHRLSPSRSRSLDSRPPGGRSYDSPPSRISHDSSLSRDRPCVSPPPRSLSLDSPLPRSRYHDSSPPRDGFHDCFPSRSMSSQSPLMHRTHGSSSRRTSHDSTPSRDSHGDSPPPKSRSPECPLTRCGSHESPPARCGSPESSASPRSGSRG